MITKQTLGGIHIEQLTVQVLLHPLGEAAEHGELDGLAGEDGGLPVEVEVHEGRRDVLLHLVRVDLTALLAHPPEVRMMSSIRY